jgi:hypothetical protein
MSVSTRRAWRASSSTARGILHHCLETGSRYDESTAWPANQALAA